MHSSNFFVVTSLPPRRQKKAEEASETGQKEKRWVTYLSRSVSSFSEGIRLGLREEGRDEPLGEATRLVAFEPAEYSLAAALRDIFLVFSGAAESRCFERILAR